YRHPSVRPEPAIGPGEGRADDKLREICEAGYRYCTAAPRFRWRSTRTTFLHPETIATFDLFCSRTTVRPGFGGRAVRPVAPWTVAADRAEREACGESG